MVVNASTDVVASIDPAAHPSKKSKGLQGASAVVSVDDDDDEGVDLKRKQSGLKQKSTSWDPKLVEELNHGSIRSLSEDGLKITCGLCFTVSHEAQPNGFLKAIKKYSEITVPTVSPFTIAKWTRHVETKGHKQKVTEAKMAQVWKGGSVGDAKQIAKLPPNPPVTPKKCVGLVSSLTAQ